MTWLVALGAGISLTTAVIGMILGRGRALMDGAIVSALITLAVFIVFMLIIHFTPEQRDRKG